MSVRCRLAAGALLDEGIDQLAGRVVHFHVESFHFAGEVVKGHNSRDGDQQSESSGNQGFRNTASHCADAGSLLRRDLLESVQDTDHRSEQPDKGCRGTDRGQTTQSPLELRVNDRFRALKGTLARFDLLFGDGAAAAKVAEL